MTTVTYYLICIALILPVLAGRPALPKDDWPAPSPIRPAANAQITQHQYLIAFFLLNTTLSNHQRFCVRYKIQMAHFPPRKLRFANLLNSEPIALCGAMMPASGLVLALPPGGVRPLSTVLGEVWLSSPASSFSWGVWEREEGPPLEGVWGTGVVGGRVLRILARSANTGHSDRRIIKEFTKHLSSNFFWCSFVV